jgi:hypothetical protein
LEVQGVKHQIYINEKLAVHGITLSKQNSKSLLCNIDFFCCCCCEIIDAVVWSNWNPSVKWCDPTISNAHKELGYSQASGKLINQSSP